MCKSKLGGSLNQNGVTEDVGHNHFRRLNRLQTRDVKAVMSLRRDDQGGKNQEEFKVFFSTYGLIVNWTKFTNSMVHIFMLSSHIADRRILTRVILK